MLPIAHYCASNTYHNSYVYLMGEDSSCKSENVAFTNLVALLTDMYSSQLNMKDESTDD